MRKLTRIIAIILTMSIAMSLAITARAAEIDVPEIIDGTSHIENAQEKTAKLMSEDFVIEETIDFVPLFNQVDYKVPYGKHGTVASHGCGITCVAMVYSYMINELHTPDELAAKYGHYNTAKGSYWSLFKDTAEDLGIPFVKSDADNGEWYSWDKVMEALENGQLVVCLQRKGRFTGGGHFILLTGITEDGKIIVNDPNGRNWNKNREMRDGFESGFTSEQIRASATAYWIYGEKEVKNKVEEEFNFDKELVVLKPSATKNDINIAYAHDARALVGN